MSRFAFMLLFLYAIISIALAFSCVAVSLGNLAERRLGWDRELTAAGFVVLVAPIVAVAVCYLAS